MSKINPTDSLNDSIAKLEQKKAMDFQNLKEQLHVTGESLKPGNLIRGAVKDVVGSPQLKSILIKAAIGIAAGFVAKKLLETQQKNTKKQMLGNALQYGASFLASNNSKLLKTAGIFVATSLINSIKNRRRRKFETNGIEHSAS